MAKILVVDDDTMVRATIRASLLRAGHAVLEAAIVATRLHLLPAEEVDAEFRRLAVAVEKTAGPREFEAWRMLEDYVRGWREGRR